MEILEFTESGLYTASEIAKRLLMNNLDVWNYRQKCCYGNNRANVGLKIDGASLNHVGKPTAG